MNNQKSQFFSVLSSAYEVYGQPLPSENALNLWVRVLEGVDFDTIRQAFSDHIKLSKFAPRPADIIELCGKILPDWHLAADEAWAMIPRDEATSAVMTEEMAEAMGIAQPLLDEGDQVAARMAFKAAYERITDANKRAGVKPKWFPSLGHDKSGREAVLQQAVRLGRLTAPHVAGLLPPSATGRGLIEV